VDVSSVTIELILSSIWVACFLIVYLTVAGGVRVFSACLLQGRFPWLLSGET